MRSGYPYCCLWRVAFISEEHNKGKKINWYFIGGNCSVELKARRLQNNTFHSFTHSLTLPLILMMFSSFINFNWHLPLLICYSPFHLTAVCIDNVTTSDDDDDNLREILSQFKEGGKSSDENHRKDEYKEQSSDSMLMHYEKGISIRQRKKKKKEKNFPVLLQSKFTFYKRTEKRCLDGSERASA